MSNFKSSNSHDIKGAMPLVKRENFKKSNESSWLRAGSYFHDLIRSRRGRVSFLLELTNCKDNARKKICT